MTHIDIICKTHGKFSQTPNAHLRGAGCKKCYHERVSARQLLTIEEFIERANSKHLGKYLYTKTEYTSAHNTVIITCPIHGDFTKKAYMHLYGKGCQQCSIDNHGKDKVKGTEKFISEAIEKFGDKYDYSKVVYTHSTTKVIISCPEHGDFQQSPSGHLNSTGCPKCAAEANSIKLRATNSNSKPTIFYYVYFPGLNLWKPGCTSISIEARYKLEQKEYKVLYQKEFPTGYEAYFIEAWILKATYSNRLEAKALDKGGNSELRTQPIDNLEELIMEAQEAFSNLN